MNAHICLEPHCVMPGCSGNQRTCSTCRGVGWVTETRRPLGAPPLTKCSQCNGNEKAPR